MELPHDPGALTAPWLTAALRASGALDRAQVESFTSTLMKADKGITGSLSRLVLSYDAVEPGAPTTLVAKFSSPHPELRAVVHSMGFFEREVRFYQQLAADTPVRTPRCYFADVDVVEGWSLILLEDLTALPNGSWVAGSSLEEVQAALAAIAAVHTAWWESAGLDGRSWLNLAGLASVAESQQVAIDTWAAFLRRLSVPVSAEIAAAGDLVQQYLHATAAYLLEAPPRTLIHHDYDGDNLFFPAVDGWPSVVVIDWQLATRGHAALDAAWLIAGQCAPAVRREHEHDLLHTYHTLLVEGGVLDYPFEQCWDDYRLAMLLAVARVSTAVGAQPGPPGGFWDVVYPRYAQALADLEVGELLKTRHAALA
jgi:hypothetical protein